MKISRRIFSVVLILLLLLFAACAPEEESTNYSDNSDYEYEDFEEDDEEINLYDSAYESLEPVDSSCFSSVGYDSSLGLLWVDFWNTGIYYYEDLSYDDYLDFISADSLGGYYNDYIKGQYPCGKLEE